MSLWAFNNFIVFHVTSAVPPGSALVLIVFPCSVVIAPPGGAGN